MESLVYDKLAMVEDNHWWFSGRRRISKYFLKQASLPSNADILECGCGTGGNLPMLAGFGKLQAFEMHGQARSQANKRGICDVADGSLPDNNPFAGESFDLICLFDVLEHIENDAAALKHLYTITKPGGRLLVTVPAMQWLWSRHDELHHHKRRYSRRELADKLKAAGFCIDKISYCNFFLFPIAAVVRIVEKYLKPQASLTGWNAPVKCINTPLTWLFSLERFPAYHLKLPFGASLIALARKAG